MDLTPKQQRFIEEYLVDLNGAQAAIRSGYSEKTARAIACELLTKPDIQAAIEEGRKRLSERTGISAERVLNELAKIAFFDVRKAVRWGKSPIDTKSENANPNDLGMYPLELVPSEEIDPATAAAIAEVALTNTGIKVKFYDKRAALVDIGKHLGMFKERDEAPDTVDNPRAASDPRVVDQLTAAQKVRGLVALQGGKE